ncbi:MAG: TetR/AcrR family transcriptional regulator [Oscillospiraceae bacterium]
MAVTRQQQKEATRQKIMQAAYAVYASEGFAATTAAIARQAGVSHGTVFAHFPTQENLLVCLVESFGAALAGSIHDLAAAGNSVEELLAAHLAILQRQEGFYTRLVAERSLLPAAVQTTLASTQSALSHHLNIRMSAEIKAGAIKNLPPHLLFNTWMGLVHYYLLNKDLFSPGAPLLPRYGAELIHAYLALVKTS